MTKLNDEELLQELRSRFNKSKETVKELQSLNTELQTANRKLEESESLKSHFIANIANEIVNPFASIMGLAKNIMHVKAMKDDKVFKMASLIYSEAFQLDFQLKNIFMAARIEAGEIDMQVCEVDVNKIINNLKEAYKPEAQKNRVEIVIESSLSDKQAIFKTDQEKLNLIISNLISNAIKFSGEDKKIEIRVWKDNNILKASVKDYGCGLSKNNQEIIFDRFKKLDTGINSVNRGHGLGLSVNKALLDILSGNIYIDTKEGEGTVITIDIPEAEKDAEGSAAAENEIFFDQSEEAEIF